ncbi:MAG: hypothetical protein CL489_05810 [Acidobacteria bacterium]|nr:hypothetical protein [Acidobacteriota bacterium]|tara:strand:- start:1846 stop:2685 length:840 start_codon:yes stop_codon:yes gene_type:complete
MSKSSRKKIIAVGCSYTEDVYKFPVWPTLLAETLDMDCVNLGAQGAGNEEMLAKTLDVVLNQKNIGLVVIMWSEWQRMDFQLWPRKWDHWWHVHPMRKAGPGWERYVERSGYVPEFQRNVNEWSPNLLGANTPHHAANRALRTFIYSQKLLKNIPYIFLQGPTPMPFYNVKTLSYIDCSENGPNGEVADFQKNNNSRQQTALALSFSPYLEYIDNNISEKFIGWPIFSELGGYDIDNILDIADPERSEMRISEDDTHPNGLGHKMIAEEIYNAYAKIYT